MKYSRGLFWILYGMVGLVAGADAARVKARARELHPDALVIQGEIKQPTELYFRRKDPEKFSSLIRRKPHFHREMLRDVVLTK